MAEAARTRRGKGRPDEGLFDRELDHLPLDARWREWMNRVEAIIFAASGGQNKSCAESYAKFERSMNIMPPVGLVLASEAI